MATKNPAQEEIYAAIAGLRRVSDAFRKRREELALSVDLTEGQWGVMEEIATLHFMPSMFAKNRSSSAAAVSKTLRQLADKGLIRSSLSKADGRQRDYELTAKRPCRPCALSASAPSPRFGVPWIGTRF
jgi:hypothetical protein